MEKYQLAEATQYKDKYHNNQVDSHYKERLMNDLLNEKLSIKYSPIPVYQYVHKLSIPDICTCN